MTSTTTPSVRTHEVPPGARRFGHLVAVAVDLALLWAVHHLLAWAWPSFLMPAFADLVPWLAASFVVGAVVHAVLVVRDTVRLRALGDLVTSVLGMVITIRTWEVFPFDLVGWQVAAARTVLVVGIVATTIGTLVSLLRLVGGAGGHAVRPAG